MTTLAIRLDPARLDNPDADLRYLLADLITSESHGAAIDDGYGYDSGQRLILYMLATDTDIALAAVRSVIESKRPLDNDLAPAVTVAVANEDHCCEASRFRVV